VKSLRLNLKTRFVDWYLPPQGFATLMRPGAFMGEPTLQIPLSKLESLSEAKSPAFPPDVDPSPSDRTENFSSHSVGEGATNLGGETAPTAICTNFSSLGAAETKESPAVEGKVHSSYLGLPSWPDAKSLDLLLEPTTPEPSAISRRVARQESAFHPQIDQRLAQIRLGVAYALYVTLRLKSPPLAAHNLRVALTVSGWGRLRGMEPTELELAEIAALLHDLGMVGVPDHILRKPGTLDRTQFLIVETARRQTVEVLRAATANERLLCIVEHVGVWYHATRCPGGESREKIPLAARMITIAEAYDSMTTDQVYRPAMSQERAVGELRACAGTQFDPHLVAEFVTQVVPRLGTLRLEAASRWLSSIDPHLADSLWQGELSQSVPPELLGLVPARLLEQMRDGVIIVDATNRVVVWNPAAERLSGITGSAVLGHPWEPHLLGLREERGQPIAPEDCPLHWALKCGAQSLRRLVLEGRSGRQIPVDVHAIPVQNHQGVVLGAILLVHDASPEVSLEAECLRLQARTALDPLTQLANRAEFDRVLPIFVAQHQQQGLPCSLIVCDLDHFKQINDIYGHQAGDEIIRTFSALLRAAARPGDLASRYGGEEFVLLCAQCDNATAAQRAEQIRFRFAQIPHPCLGHKTVTASFGVTELQPGDSPESFFRRADRALLAAKTRGRNQVVQLGVGSDWPEKSAVRRWFPALPGFASASVVVKERLRVYGPLPLVIEKLQGFVSDHQAQVLRAQQDQVELELEHRPIGMRRRTDRPITFHIQLRLQEISGNNPPSNPRLPSGANKAGEILPHSSCNSGEQTPNFSATKYTTIHVEICPASSRERRRQEIAARARNVLESLRAYLMAQPEPTAEAAPRTSSRRWLPWPRFSS
jgi:diguanylate cyclase (GGDEF)-like protein/PAS domain S-box-containing protein